MFEIVDFEKLAERKRLQDNELAINANERTKNYSITFNQNISEVIRRAGYTDVKLAKDEETKTLRFMFCIGDGVHISWQNDRNVQIVRKSLVLYVHKFLKLPQTEREVLKYEKVGTLGNCLFIDVRNKFTQIHF